MKNTLSILILFLCISMQAQEISLKWAEKIKTKKHITILGGKNTNYYTQHLNKKDNLVIRKYGENLNLKSEKIVGFDLSEKRAYYSGAKFLDDKILHFISKEKRKEKKKYLFGGFTDLNLNTENKLFVLDEENSKYANSMGSRTVSPDSTKVLVYHERTTKRKEADLLVYKVYNSSLTKVIHEGAKKLPIKSKNFSSEEIEVDNFGNVYILAKVYKERKQQKKGHSKYYYNLIVFPVEGKVAQFKFDYPENNIASVSMLPSKDNTFICTGFLKNLKGGRKKLISDEMFVSIIDCKTMSLTSTKKYELEGLYPEKMRKSSDYVPYLVRNIFHRKDGGFVVVAEQYKLTVHRTQKHTYYRYYYCDIACVNISSSGEVESISKTPKYQLNAGNPSIISTHVDGTTYIIYEDLTKNAQATSDRKTKRTSGKGGKNKNSLFLLSIASSGETDKDIIFSYKDSKITPNIRASVVVGDNKILLSGNDQLGLLTIEK